jgi:hypothetical protein
MAKTTVHGITVTIAGDPPVELLPATNTTTVHTIGVAIANSPQTATIKPAE